MLVGRRVRSLYFLGATAALATVAALLFDIGLAMVPGWGTSSTPLEARQWLELFAANPLLGLRNLDLLNAAVSLVALPMYFALFAPHRKTTALLGLLCAVVGATLFAGANAALPMLDLSKQYAVASTAAERAAIEGGAAALLARGAHGGLGVFPGFLLSELGTLLMAVAMLGSRVFTRGEAWLGLAGACSLIVYSITMTFTSVAEPLVLAVAAPGGLLLVAWHALVARKLFMLSGKGRAPAPAEDPSSVAAAVL